MPAILLVENDLSLAETLMPLLENASLSVEHCSTGSVAIQLIQANRYAVVVLDVVLESGISGMYVANAVRRQPEQKRPKILMLAGANVESLRGVDRSVVTAVMFKPLNFPLFVDFVVAMYGRAERVPETVSRSERIHTFCGSCGSEITPWVEERPSRMPLLAYEHAFDSWAETPCRNCGTPPRLSGGHTLLK